VNGASTSVPSVIVLEDDDSARNQEIEECVEATGDRLVLVTVEAQCQDRPRLRCIAREGVLEPASFEPVRAPGESHRGASLLLQCSCRGSWIRRGRPAIRWPWRRHEPGLPAVAPSKLSKRTERWSSESMYSSIAALMPKAPDTALHDVTSARLYPLCAAPQAVDEPGTSASSCTTGTSSRARAPCSERRGNGCGRAN
jgi:hypothetical protein